jgi:hypothetical protein
MLRLLAQPDKRDTRTRLTAWPKRRKTDLISAFTRLQALEGQDNLRQKAPNGAVAEWLKAAVC